MQAKRPGTDLQFESGMGITKVYESATTLIGEGPLENGKTMGLAAYGEPRNYPPLFIGTVPIDQYFVHSDWTVTVSSQRAGLQTKLLQKIINNMLTGHTTFSKRHRKH